MPDPNSHLSLLTRREVSKQLQVSRSTLKRWAKQKRLVPLFLGPKVLRYAPSEVEALLRAGYQPDHSSKTGRKPKTQPDTDSDNDDNT